MTISHLCPRCHPVVPLACPQHSPALVELHRHSTGVSDRSSNAHSPALPSNQFHGVDAPDGTFATMLVQCKSAALVEHQARIALEL